MHACATPVIFGDARILRECAQRTGLAAPRQIVSEAEWTAKGARIDAPCVLDALAEPARRVNQRTLTR